MNRTRIWNKQSKHVKQYMKAMRKEESDVDYRMRSVQTDGSIKKEKKKKLVDDDVDPYATIPIPMRVTVPIFVCYATCRVKP